MQTAIEDPDDDSARALAAEYREKMTGQIPAALIDEIIEQANADYTRYKADEIKPEDTRPEGYGKLNETYRWVPVEVPGKGSVVRAWCITDDKIMTTTIKVDPRYGRTQNKHTRGKQAVVYNGKPVLSWECRDCGQWVIQ